jgi:hypothetical protein
VPNDDRVCRLHKTLSYADLEEPVARATARRLNLFLWKLALRGERVAVNGVLRRRWYVRRHKMWEYARGLGYTEPRAGAEVLDFGGAATLPVFYLAAIGARVKCLDVDLQLSGHTQALARSRGWSLEASTIDLTENRAPEGWGPFDRIYSFSVIEHLPQERQRNAMARLAAMLKPGGQFALTFDFGQDAPEEGAIRDLAGVETLIDASGLAPRGGGRWKDTGERFALNKRHRDRRFTFGSLFLEKRA